MLDTGPDKALRYIPKKKIVFLFYFLININVGGERCFLKRVSLQFSYAKALEQVNYFALFNSGELMSNIDNSFLPDQLTTIYTLSIAPIALVMD